MRSTAVGINQDEDVAIDRDKPKQDRERRSDRLVSACSAVKAAKNDHCSSHRDEHKQIRSDRSRLRPVSNIRELYQKRDNSDANCAGESLCNQHVPKPNARQDLTRTR